MLEEEVVRLEEQIVHLRQGLYQEAVYKIMITQHTAFSNIKFNSYRVEKSLY